MHIFARVTSRNFFKPLVRGPNHENPKARKETKIATIANFIANFMSRQKKARNSGGNGGWLATHKIYKPNMGKNWVKVLKKLKKCDINIILIKIVRGIWNLWILCRASDSGYSIQDIGFRILRRCDYVRRRFKDIRRIYKVQQIF